jgi:hypothetical protein
MEYELLRWIEMTLWHCRRCRRFRHREELKEHLPAKCCGVEMVQIDHYKQPVKITCVQKI